MRILDASFMIKHFLVLFLFLFGGTAYCAVKACVPPEIMKHTVIVKYKLNISQERVEELTAEYANLKNIVPELKDWKWGVDLGPGVEDRANGFTHSYESTFHSVEDFIKFFYNPETLKFGNKFFPSVEKYVVLNYIFNTSFPYTWSLPYRWSPDEKLSRKVTSQ